MIPHNPPARPTSSTVGARVLLLEEKYSICIKFWLSLEQDRNDQHYFAVHVAGSGDIFDHLPGAAGQARARVVGAFPDPLPSALWECLNHLEHSIEKSGIAPIACPSQ